MAIRVTPPLPQVMLHGHRRLLSERSGKRSEDFTKYASSDQSSPTKGGFPVCSLIMCLLSALAAAQLPTITERWGLRNEEGKWSHIKEDFITLRHYEMSDATFPVHHDILRLGRWIRKSWSTSNSARRPRSGQAYWMDYFLKAQRIRM